MPSSRYAGVTRLRTAPKAQSSGWLPLHLLPRLWDGSTLQVAYPAFALMKPFGKQLLKGSPPSDHMHRILSDYHRSSSCKCWGNRAWDRRTSVLACVHCRGHITHLTFGHKPCKERHLLGSPSA